MRVRVLGPVEVHRDGQWQRLSASKQRSLLTALVISAGRPVSVDRLTEELWPEGPPRTAANQIHVYVGRLRRALGDGGGVLLRTRSPGYELAAGPDDVDAVIFERLAEQGTAAFRDGDAERGSALLAEALDLWRGPAFADVPDSPTVRAEADRLDEARIVALESRIDADLELGRHAELISELRVLVDAHPYRERLWARLMLALYRSGRQADALKTYQQAYRLFTDELGLEPGPELGRLEQAILTGDSELDPGPREPSRVRPAQLPADIAAFSGRHEQLARLDALLADHDRTPTAVVITAIEGTAGVGKSALAVHWAHRIADRFPDGQLYVNLRGFDPVGVVMSPGEAIRGFLDALRVPPNQIPVGLEAQIGLYRSLLAQRRMLIVLDNARDADHVRPLLPGSPGCLVVVTSRNQLSGLVATEAAHPVMLDVLSADEARDLLAHRLGPERVEAEPEAVDSLVERCARLPLALAIVAARAAGHPHFGLATLAAELLGAGASGPDPTGRSHPSDPSDPSDPDEDDDRSPGLGVLSTGDTASDLRTVFSWSYHTLKPEAARLFRFLGVHPGPHIGVTAAASLAGMPPREVRPLLAELTRAHLIEEQAPGRYAFHDLLRTYAAELAQSHEPRSERRQAWARVLDHYLHTAYTAARVLDPARKPLDLDRPATGVTLEPIAGFDEAVTWFTEQHAELLAAMDRAAQTGFETHIMRMAWAFWDYLDKQGHWHDWLATQHAALDAAVRAKDRDWQGRAHGGLGTVYARLGDYDEARSHLEQAVETFAALKDPVRQAGVHLTLSHLAGLRDDHAEALANTERARALYEETGDRGGQADALNGIGWCYAQLGEYEQAIRCTREAIELQRELGDREGEAHATDSLGYAQHRLGRYDEAEHCFRQALDIHRDLGNRYYQADTLTHLGDTQHAAGDREAARESWQAALKLLEELDHADAEGVRARLADV